MSARKKKAAGGSSTPRKPDSDVMDRPYETPGIHRCIECRAALVLVGEFACCPNSHGRMIPTYLEGMRKIYPGAEFIRGNPSLTFNAMAQSAAYMNENGLTPKHSEYDWEADEDDACDQCQWWIEQANQQEQRT